MSVSLPFMRRGAVKALGCLLATVLALHLVPAQAGFQFDPSFLEIGGGQGSTELQQQIGAMSEGQLPGVYRVGISLNQRFVDQRDIRFVRATGGANPSDTGLFPCLDADFFRSQGVAEQALAKRTDADPTCLAFDQGLAGVSYDYDFNQQTLAIEVPQAYLGEIPFEVRRRQWSSGERVAFTHYSLSGSSVQSETGRRQDQFGSFRSGLNAGAWRLRNFSTWRKGSDTPGRWESLETYAQRDLGDMMAMATVGDAATEGDLFDAIPYRGVGIASDLEMLPDQARGFAPVIRGIANGRSRVIIRQRGYVIHEQWVPSGPFALTDLYPTASNGDIEVTVQSADGQVQVYTQSFSSVPYMLREGQQTYSLYAGRYRPSSDFGQDTPVFLQGTLRRGLVQGTTVFGGTLLSDRYSAALLGVAHDFAGFGALSVDVTHARAAEVGPDHSTQSGQSLRFRYSKSLAVTNTTFSLVGYRYSTSGYYAFAEALDSRANAQVVQPYRKPGELLPAVSYRSGHMKSNFNANISQQLGHYGAMFATLSKTAYWASDAADTNLQMGYNFSVGDISYSLGAGVTQGQTRDRNLTLSFSMPLGGSGNRRLSATTSRSARGNASHMATLSGNALQDDVLAYSAGVSQRVSAGQGAAGGAFAAQYDAPNAIFHGGYNQSGDNRQLDLGMEGSVVAYDSQVIFGQPLGETNVIVAAPGAAHVSLTNKRGVRTNGNGYAVVPSAMPYRKNRISLDTQTIAQNVDIQQLVQDVTPNRGAFVVADFETRSGRRILFHISDPQGQVAPFAASAELFAADGRSLGSTLVADSGRAFLTGVPPQARLQVSAGGQPWCSVELHLDDEDAAAGITQMNLQCERTPGTASAKDS
ncbi:fimbrial biogenesis outer membrane usher protein [Pseudomonas sp. 21LCFQ010]|uniref:fimbria/pilus outer membrane usher protein n=1 Tax=Pseudomonas sp. 21LCFQ010 TaxID=2957506 RepID=UPI002096F064|nr:fimbria/pilus outer membrane usher protein [Pseudomonas sp. 21LCFQ010]MCO8162959.1 fimbrial biogenesis outer membrane usher protein [Pseudomonas sp. 21LCFQ010]